MTIHSFTITYRPDTEDDYTYPAGIMAICGETGEIVCAALPADHAAAPVEHSQTAVDEIMAFYAEMEQWFDAMGHDAESAFMESPLTRYECIWMEDNPVIEADDLDTGVITLLGRHVLEGLGHTEAVYQTFSIVYRVSTDENYPLAVFAYDPVQGRFTIEVLGKENAYLPRLSRQQRRAIDREMAKFVRKMERGDVQGALDGLDRPRFGVFTIDDYQAVSPWHALEQAMADLDEIHLDTGGGAGLAS